MITGDLEKILTQLSVGLAPVSMQSRCSYENEESKSTREYSPIRCKHSRQQEMLIL